MHPGGQAAPFTALPDTLAEAAAAALALDGEVHGLSRPSGGATAWFELIDRSGAPRHDAASIQVSAPARLCGGIKNGTQVRVQGAVVVRTDGARLELRAKNLTVIQGDPWYTPDGQRSYVAAAPTLSRLAREKLAAVSGRASRDRLPIRVPAGRALRVHWVGPLSDTTRFDIEHALDSRVHSTWTSVSFRNAADIAAGVLDAARTAPAVDAIVIFRGGGSWRDWQVLSDPQLLNVVAASAVPVITAVGHQQDTPPITEVSLANVNTPTNAAKAIGSLLYRAGPALPRRRGADDPAQRRMAGAFRLAHADLEATRQQRDQLQRQLDAAREQHRVLIADRAAADADATRWRSAVGDRARSQALMRIHLRGRRQAAAIALSTIAAVLFAPTVLEALMPTWRSVLLETVMLTVGTLLAAYTARSRGRALRPTRPGMAGRADTTDAWLRELDTVRTPRRFRAMQGAPR